MIMTTTLTALALRKSEVMPVITPPGREGGRERGRERWEGRGREKPWRYTLTAVSVFVLVGSCLPMIPPTSNNAASQSDSLRLNPGSEKRERERG